MKTFRQKKMYWKVKQMILEAIYRESIAQLVSSVCKLSAPAMHLLLKTSQRYLQMEKSLIFFKRVQQKLKHGKKNLGFNSNGVEIFEAFCFKLVRLRS